MAGGKAMKKKIIMLWLQIF